MSSPRRAASLPDCLAYVEAILDHKSGFQPAFRELLQLQVCARCCLRYAGVRSDVYAKPAPLSTELYAAYEEALSSKDGRFSVHTSDGTVDTRRIEAREPARPDTYTQGDNRTGVSHRYNQSEASLDEPSDPGCPNPNLAAGNGHIEITNQDSNMASAPVSGQAQLSKAAAGHMRSAPKQGSDQEPVCRVCLGILQSLDGPVQPVTADIMDDLSERDGGGAPWSAVTGGDPDSIAQHIQSLAYACRSFAVELSLPASTQLRQLAMWYHLKLHTETAALFGGETLREDVVDLKESLRLRGTLAEPIASALGMPLDARDGDLRITLNYIHPASASESDFLFGRPFKGRSQKRRRKRTVTDVEQLEVSCAQDARQAGNTEWPGLGRSSGEAIATALAKWSIDKFREECAVPPVPSSQGAHLMLASRRLPLYIGGLYRKLQRDISQSPWTIDGQKKGRTSVQEEIEKVLLPSLRCDGSKFVTAGREDMDVRMLGDGRPFVMEIQNQRAEMPEKGFFQSVQDELKKSGGGVEVRCLQPVGKEKLQAIKDGEQNKQKSYEAICQLPCELTQDMVKKINSCTNLLLGQNTPQRVAHRRALLLRERMVYTMQCSPLEEDATMFKLNLRTQAGTYIKEFVHGDEGRTEPNLGTFLGCAKPAKILQLDVLQIHMDFLQCY